MLTVSKIKLEPILEEGTEDGLQSTFKEISLSEALQELDLSMTVFSVQKETLAKQALITLQNSLEKLNQLDREINYLYAEIQAEVSYFKKPTLPLPPQIQNHVSNILQKLDNLTIACQTHRQKMINPSKLEDEMCKVVINNAKKHHEEQLALKKIKQNILDVFSTAIKICFDVLSGYPGKATNIFPYDPNLFIDPDKKNELEKYYVEHPDQKSKIKNEFIELATTIECIDRSVNNYFDSTRFDFNLNQSYLINPRDKKAFNEVFGYLAIIDANNKLVFSSITSNDSLQTLSLNLNSILVKAASISRRLWNKYPLFINTLLNEINDYSLVVDKKLFWNTKTKDIISLETYHTAMKINKHCMKLQQDHKLYAQNTIAAESNAANKLESYIKNEVSHIKIQIHSLHQAKLQQQWFNIILIKLIRLWNQDLQESTTVNLPTKDELLYMMNLLITHLDTHTIDKGLCQMKDYAAGISGKKFYTLFSSVDPNNLNEQDVQMFKSNINKIV